LPDYLPMVLEYAAVADPEGGEALLRQYRPSLELLRIGLEEDRTAATAGYAAVVAAVCATLPGASPKDRAAVQALVGGPPTESVGLDPYDPRLLPMAGGR
ncbi:MAG: nitrate reductase molybdenum cofactor assembly chaperone, partial [Actinomycetales bacterium]